MILDMLGDGFWAAVATVGFASLSRPTGQILCMAAFLAALGRMSRLALMQAAHLGIVSATLLAAMFIALCSMPFAKRLRTPAEMFVFPALLPMIPGMFAYQAILATLRFMRAGGGPEGLALLSDIVFNGLTALFVLCALAIGSTVPLLIFHRESLLGKLWRHLQEQEQEQEREKR